MLDIKNLKENVDNLNAEELMIFIKSIYELGYDSFSEIDRVNSLEDTEGRQSDMDEDLESHLFYYFNE
jgi:hypothetical protein